MKSLYKLLFICILAFTAVSAGNFALNTIDEQHTEIRNHVRKTHSDELESLYKYTPVQSPGYGDLRVNDRMSPDLKNAINKMEKQMYGN